MQVISKLEALHALAYFGTATKEGFKLCMGTSWAMDLYETLMTVVDPLLRKMPICLCMELFTECQVICDQVISLYLPLFPFPEEIYVKNLWMNFYFLKGL